MASLKFGHLSTGSWKTALFSLPRAGKYQTTTIRGDCSDSRDEKQCFFEQSVLKPSLNKVENPELSICQHGHLWNAVADKGHGKRKKSVKDPNLPVGTSCSCHWPLPGHCYCKLWTNHVTFQVYLTTYKSAHLFPYLNKNSRKKILIYTQTMKEKSL